MIIREAIFISLIFQLQKWVTHFAWHWSRERGVNPPLPSHRVQRGEMKACVCEFQRTTAKKFLATRLLLQRSCKSVDFEPVERELFAREVSKRGGISLGGRHNSFNSNGVDRVNSASTGGFRNYPTARAKIFNFDKSTIGS